ncbi:MAG: hypothetical protein AB7U41_01760 [Dongiaceae bacterium]
MKTRIANVADLFLGESANINKPKPVLPHQANGIDLNPASLRQQAQASYKQLEQRVTALEALVAELTKKDSAA